MNLHQRIDLLIRLGKYILSEEEAWKEAKRNAELQNNWFIQDFIERATHSIAHQFLDPEKLTSFIGSYNIPLENKQAKTVGLVMAGNIPLVGFHDWLCIFLTGHRALLKASSKDEVLISHLVNKLCAWAPELTDEIRFAHVLKGCDAYIATGSNNSARYFDYYFSRYPSIIRRNRTSVAVLEGNESTTELARLSDDVNVYFGLGCRNATKLFVPAGYDFIPLLEAFNRYDWFANLKKYKNNYDYQLAVHLLNQKYYMTNGSVLLSENESFFSPISQVNYSFYTHRAMLEESLKSKPELQCIIGHGHIPFGQAQNPSLTDYPDGTDTTKFLLSL